MPQVQVDKVALEASICRDSFYDFVQRFWGVVCQEDPVWNWHIYELCHYLQVAAERVFKGLPKKHDMVINVPPGSTKSIICSEMYPVWCWTRMPTCRIISVSYAYNLAADLSGYSRDIVESEKWKELFPDVWLRGDKNAKHNYENNHGGWRYAVGVGGKVTGRHGHIIIIDDPIDPAMAISETVLKSTNRFISETLSTRKVDKKITFTILVMQRLHQNDPSAIKLKKAKEENGTPVKHINLPGEITGNGRDVVRPRRLAKYYKEGLFDVVRLDRDALVALLSDLGQYGYAGQILQRPAPPGGGMFKIGRITIEKSSGPLRHFKEVVRFWDKAGTKDGGAFTAGIKMGLDSKDRYWVLGRAYGQWDSAAREDVIEQTTKLDTISCIVGVEQEPGSGGKESAEATAKRLAGFRVRIVRPTGDKTTRADPFSVQVNAGNVYMVEGPWNRSYLEELELFPSSTYKDQVDASSGAFGLLTKNRVRVGGLFT